MNGPQSVSIWVYRHGGQRERVTVTAGPTPVPGLVVNEDPVHSGTWNITHAASGAAVATDLPDPEAALHIAGKLGGVCDWTMASREMAAIRDGLAGRLEQALGDAGAMEFQRWRHKIPTGSLVGGDAA